MVVIVLTLMGGAVFTLMNQSQRSYQSQQDLSEAVQQAGNAMDQIITTLRQAGNDPLESFENESPAFGHTHSGRFPIEISGTGSIQISSDITGSVSNRGDPDGTLDQYYEKVVFRYDSGAQNLYIDIGEGEDVLAENITTFALTYYDIAGTQLTDPANNEKDIARVHVQLVAETENPDLQTDKILIVTLQSDIMLRSKTYGLFELN